MKGSDLLVKALENEGVRYIFGVPGEENLDLVESLQSSSIELVVTRHEQPAAFMAATYGRLTGKPTVSLSLVLISPTAPAEAQALRDWGDFVHINHIVEAGIPGFTMITPYENATKGDPRYMHFYEFDDPEAEITFKRMRPLVEARIGAWETPECQAWAMHPALRIMYVNSFALVGES